MPILKERKDDPRCTIKTDDKIGAQLFHCDAPLEIHLLRGELSKPIDVAEPALPAVFAVDKKLFDPAAVPPAQRRAIFAKWLGGQLRHRDKGPVGREYSLRNQRVNMWSL